MITRKKRNLLVIIAICITALIIIGILVALYFTTDMFKSNNSLFTKYILQNVNKIEDIAKQKSVQIQDAIQNQKLETNLTAKINYTDNTGNTENSINQAEIDISSQIDNKNQYDYKNIRLAYENENITKVEYLKNGETYGVRLDGVMQFVSATNQNLDDLELKTGISKQNLEFLTYAFNPVTLSQFISFTPSEIEILSSTYLSIIEQNTQKNQYQKSKQDIEINGNTYKTTAYSLKQTQEQLNNLIIAILERVEKDQVLLGKIDILEEQLSKYYLYTEDRPLREVVTELIDDEIQDIKNHNIGQEETEITVYVYKGQTIRTLIKTQEESISMDVGQNVEVNYIQNLDNSVVKNNFKFEKVAQENSQNILIEYHKKQDEEEKQGIELKIDQNKENDKIENNYYIQYNIEGNTAKIDASQYINIVNNFENQINFDEKNNMDIDNLDKDATQEIINFLDNKYRENISNILERIKLEDINNMLKDLKILRENEIIFDDEPDEETVTEAERSRFNSQLVLFIGKEVTKDTLQQLLEVTKDCLQDAQITYENEDNQDKKRMRGIIMNIKRNTSNDEKTEELKKVLEENGDKKYTVAMAFDETTRLINQITIVSNEFLEQ